MVKPYIKQNGSKDLEERNMTLDRHHTKKFEILLAHKKERQQTNNCTRRDHSREMSTRSTKQHLVRRHQGVDRAEWDGNVPEWLPTVTCRVSSRVNLRQEDDNPR